MKYYLLLITIVCLTSCNLINKTEVDIVPELCNCWTDSYEEYETDSMFKIFRPCDYEKIPPSRFRQTIDIKKNGNISWLRLASNDKHTMIQGTWSYDSELKTLSVYNTQKTYEIDKLIVTTLQKDKLIIKGNNILP